MTTETQLWAWLLSGTELPTWRAKEILAACEQQGLTLSTAVAHLPGGARALGLHPQEAAHLRQAAPTGAAPLPAVTALRWDDALYPEGWRKLALKLRPALLYYQGAVELLARPWCYLLPNAEAGASELLREMVNLLLDEPLLLAAYAGSPQASLLLEEVQQSAGAALLLAPTGLAHYRPGPTASALLEEERLLVVTPLPPDTESSPRIDELLQQLAVAAAWRVLATDRAVLNEDTTGGAPVLLLEEEGEVEQPPAEAEHARAAACEPTTTYAATPPNVQRLASPADIFEHLAELVEEELPASEPAFRGSAAAAGATGDDLPFTVDASPLGSDAPLEPPPDPQDVLATLEKGGNVPEALKKRLLGDS